jgi:hypothetical protein
MWTVVLSTGSTIANKCPMKVGLAYIPGSPVGFFSGYMDEVSMDVFLLIATFCFQDDL